MGNGNKKRGRKANHHIAADGTQIKGLAYDKGSGRWRVIETNRFFRAPDEETAIKKFYGLAAKAETPEEKAERLEIRRQRGSAR